MYQKLCAKVLPRFIPDHSRILVAISGGPDSVALAHVLWRYANDYREKGISLVLSHIHHGMRAESDQEAELVQDLARQWDLHCIVHRFNAKEYVKEQGRSFQEGAREWRYARWKEDMLLHGCNLLSTAHHMGDQAETILYRLIRGSGTAGLGGIYPGKDGMIRPFLGVSKKEILDYCKREQLPYAIDLSNLDSVYVRNKIRLELIPELEKEYNPQIVQGLARMGELLRWDEDYIESQVARLWQKYCTEERTDKVCLKKEVFTEPPALLSRLIRRGVSSVAQEPKGIGFGYVETIMANGKASNWVQHLPGVTVRIEKNGIWFETFDHMPKGIQDFEYFLPMNTWVGVPELDLEIGVFEKENGTNVGGKEDFLYKAIWDEEKIKALPSIVLRNRRQGDKIWIKGVGHKELKKIFQEANVPAVERNQMSVIASGAEVLWIPGIKMSDKYKTLEEVHVLTCIIRSKEQETRGSL